MRIEAGVTTDAHTSAHVAAITPNRHSQPVDPGLLNALNIVAHDLRGPLANLAVLLELIAAYVHVQSYDRVKPCTEKALDAIIHAFLERARDTGDPLAFQLVLVDLADVVGKVVDQNRPIAESRDVEFDVGGVRPLTVSGDPRLLVEAVDNLVSNAVKHAPEGSTVICETALEGRQAVIRIGDEGKGLSDLDLQKASRPFASPATRRRVRAGSFGLGLWIVRLIAERHGGSVHARSRESGSGAVFEIRLPINRI